MGLPTVTGVGRALVRLVPSTFSCNPGDEIKVACLFVAVLIVGVLSSCGAEPGPAPTVAPGPTANVPSSPAATATPQPIVTSTPAPAPQVSVSPTQSPASTDVEWVRHAVHRFEIDVPADWVGLEVRPESIDAMIESVPSTNPDLVPYIESLKRQQGPMKFWAFRPIPDPQFLENISVIHQPAGVPIDRLLDTIKPQLGAMGLALVAEQRSSLSGRDALRIHLTGAIASAAGAPLEVDIQQVIVDYGLDRYTITLTTLVGETTEYKELFDWVARSFSAVEGGSDLALTAGQAVPPPPGYRSPTLTSAGSPHLGSPDEHHPDYTSKPATSGWHVGQTVRWGLYQEFVPDEILVHNLEHAGVGVHYNCPEGCSDLLAKLVQILNRSADNWVDEWVGEMRAAGDRALLAHAEDVRDHFKVVMSPYPDMDARVALTAWGFIDKLEEFDRSRILDFLKAHIMSTDAPEPYAQ